MSLLVGIGTTMTPELKGGASLMSLKFQICKMLPTFAQLYHNPATYDNQIFTSEGNNLLLCVSPNWCFSSSSSHERLINLQLGSSLACSLGPIKIMYFI